MSEFNRMTIVAATEVISLCNSHSDMEVYEVQWGLSGRCSANSKSARIVSWAKIAIDEEPEVMTENGKMTLGRALVETAIKAPDHLHQSKEWMKFVAGLHFDGFEVVFTEVEIAPANAWSQSSTKVVAELKRMLPQDVPGLDFREAESEVVTLLRQSGFNVAEGHLSQAMSAFQRGEWAAANGALRNFFEGYLNEMAVRLGYAGNGDGKDKRDYLGHLQPPFLLPDYNEWNPNNQKPQFVQGLMSRMHPHGAHPGLSEEDDATFRLQISLVTARLFLRRFKQRIK